MYKAVVIIQCFLVLFFTKTMFSQMPVNYVLKTMQIDTNFVYHDTLLTQIQQSGIYLQAPKYFFPSEDAPILTHSGTSTTFEFKKISALPYVYLNEAFLKEDFAKQNVTLDTSKEITLENGNPGILHYFSFSSNGKDFQRITLLTGDYHNTVWVDVSCLEQFFPYMETLLVKSLKTVKYNSINK